MTECERRLAREQARKNHWRSEHEKLRELARDLIEAVKAHDPALQSNDLGNAIDALERAL